MSGSKKETERAKLIQEKCQTLLTQMLRDEDNKYCVDCDAKGPRWASWNIGVFLCIRCAGIHRNLGVHISRVKSVNLDTWTPEQVISLQQMGNSRARAVYEAQLPDGFRRPQTDTALESFIRAKYEHKKYLAREWVPPSPPKVDWAKEIDEEIEKQKRKKKAAQGGASIGLVGAASSLSSEKKSSSVSSAAKNSPLPAPLPKPKPSNSPKLHRTSESANSSGISDLLGLASPTSSNGQSHDSQNDSFTGFLSAPVSANGAINMQDNKQNSGTTAAAPMPTTVPNSLAKEEQDFFSQTSLAGGDKSGKMSKDSILALYASGPTSSPQASLGQFNNNPLVGFNTTFTGGNPQTTFPQQQQPQQQQLLGGLNMGGMGLQQNQFGQGMNLAGMPPGLLGQPHQQQAQFMTPPNSAAMYNAPVMTAPAAFTSPMVHHHPQMMGMHHQQQQQQSGFAQFPSMQAYSSGAGGLSNAFGSPSAGGIMATGQPGGGLMSMMQTAGNPTAANVAPSANLNQQFGNLNLGNVWQ